MLDKVTIFNDHIEGYDGDLVLFAPDTVTITSTNTAIYNNFQAPDLVTLGATTVDSLIIGTFIVTSPTAASQVLISTAANAASWVDPIWPRLLEADETIFIRASGGSDSNDGESSGTALATIQKGIDFLYRRIANGYTITMDLGEGTYTPTSALEPAYPYGYNVRWRGVSASYTSVVVSDVGAVTASSPAWSGLSYIDFDVVLPENAANAGEFVSVTASTGGANPELCLGVHQVTSTDEEGAPEGYENITIRMFRRTGPTAVFTTSAVLSLTVIKTIIHSSSSTSGIKLNGAFHSGTWGEADYGIVFRGTDAESNDNGLWALNGASIVLGPDAATSGWETNLYAQNGALIFADYTAHSKCSGDIVKCQNGAAVNLRFGAVLSGSAARGIRSFLGGTVAFNQSYVILAGANFGVQCYQGATVDCDSSTLRYGHANSIALSTNSGGVISASSTTIDGYTLEVDNDDERGKVFDGDEGTVYGEIYAFDAMLTHTISGTGIGNKVKVTAFNANGESKRATPDHTGDDITVDVAGEYLCTVSINLESVAGGVQTAGAAVYKNSGATLFAGLHIHRKLSGGGGDLGAMSMSGIVSLAVGDTIEVWIWNSTTGDLIVDDITLSIVRLGR